MLYIKKLERQKYLALNKSGKNYDSRMIIIINHDTIDGELDRWLRNIPQVKNNILQDKFDIEIYTDASKTGVDNTTALSYINRIGSIRYPNLNRLSREIWSWCESRDIWLYASYVPTASNLADKSSRILSPDTEWELDKDTFKAIVDRFGKVNIDLFASSINFKCKTYVSWYRDPRVIINYLSKLSRQELSIEDLGKKLATLLALTTGHRIQTISLIRIQNVIFLEDRVKVFITDNIKTSGVNIVQPCLEIPYFDEHPNLCVAVTLNNYIESTISMRANKWKRTSIIMKLTKENLEVHNIDEPMWKNHTFLNVSTNKTVDEILLNTDGVLDITQNSDQRHNLNTDHNTALVDETKILESSGDKVIVDLDSIKSQNVQASPSGQNQATKGNKPELTNLKIDGLQNSFDSSSTNSEPFGSGASNRDSDYNHLQRALHHLLTQVMKQSQQTHELWNSAGSVELLIV
ncbi:hypothetical protein NQ314_021387 [Rhamnusium bicolor]|uniref:Uncharacterized protein n=1 Tax=Rhamnusium bicolor TaxID=1586634 RepID=A0AAV8WIF6_9CUCU|nr:hypothetical protein NQ314_021387 [Rhamnusium bicolor]